MLTLGLKLDNALRRALSTSNKKVPEEFDTPEKAAAQYNAAMNPLIKAATRKGVFSGKVLRGLAYKIFKPRSTYPNSPYAPPAPNSEAANVLNKFADEMWKEVEMASDAQEAALAAAASAPPGHGVAAEMAKKLDFKVPLPPAKKQPKKRQIDQTDNIGAATARPASKKRKSGLGNKPAKAKPGGRKLLEELEADETETEEEGDYSDSESEDVDKVTKFTNNSNIY